MKPILRHRFLWMILAAFWLGHVFADVVAAVSSVPGLRWGLVAIVMGAGGCGMPMATITRRLRHPGSVVVAVAVNVVGVPLWMAAAMLAAGPLIDTPTRGGLWVAALVPCTLASAMVWTRRAGGDVSIALLTTVITNMAAPVVMPLGLAVVDRLGGASREILGGPAGETLGGASGELIGIDAASMATKLSVVVVLPLAAAQVIRRRRTAADWLDARGKTLSAISQTGILLMVAFGSAAGALAAGPHDGGLAAEPHDGGLAAGSAWFPAVSPVVAVVVAAVHLAAFATAYAAAGWVDRRRPRDSAGDNGDDSNNRAVQDNRASRDAAIAAGIAGSQKTLMVGLGIALDLGVSVAPMIAFHVLQLLIDTILARPTSVLNRDAPRTYTS